MTFPTALGGIRGGRDDSWEKTAGDAAPVVELRSGLESSVEGDEKQIVIVDACAQRATVPVSQTPKLDRLS